MLSHNLDLLNTPNAGVLLQQLFGRPPSVSAVLRDDVLPSSEVARISGPSHHDIHLPDFSTSQQHHQAARQRDKLPAEMRPHEAAENVARRDVSQKVLQGEADVHRRKEKRKPSSGLSGVINFSDIFSRGFGRRLLCRFTSSISSCGTSSVSSPASKSRRWRCQQKVQFSSPSKSTKAFPSIQRSTCCYSARTSPPSNGIRLRL